MASTHKKTKGGTWYVSYVISLLIALRHWYDAHGIDWQSDLARAQKLFEEDLAELTRPLADPAGTAHDGFKE